MPPLQSCSGIKAKRKREPDAYTVEAVAPLGVFSLQSPSAAPQSLPHQPWQMFVCHVGIPFARSLIRRWWEGGRGSVKAGAGYVEDISLHGISGVTARSLSLV
jgi:hypothetical protein